MHGPELSSFFVCELYLLIAEFNLKRFFLQDNLLIFLGPVLSVLVHLRYLLLFLLDFFIFLHALVPHRLAQRRRKYQDCLVFSYTHLEPMNVDSRSSY
jgi:hypothetical protein